MTNSLRIGENRADGITFFVADPKTGKKLGSKQRELRVKKARAMAAELGQTIGKPWEVSEEPGFDSQVVTVNANSYIRYQMPMQQEQSTLAGCSPALNYSGAVMQKKLL
jgi:uncharacterized protein YggE